MKLKKGIAPNETRGRKSKYNFTDMSVGQYFTVSGGRSVQASILTCAARYRPRKFTTRLEYKNGILIVRCWRTK